MQKVIIRFFMLAILLGVTLVVHLKVKLRYDMPITIVEQLTGENAIGLAYISPDSNVIYIDKEHINTANMQAVPFTIFQKFLCFFTVSPFNISGAYTFDSDKYMMLESVNSKSPAVEIRLNDKGRVVQLKNVRQFFEKMNCIEN